jgi:hypothetical protein
MYDELLNLEVLNLSHYLRDISIKVKIINFHIIIHNEAEEN